jgi:hypothetical protein
MKFENEEFGSVEDGESRGEVVNEGVTPQTVDEGHFERLTDQQLIDDFALLLDTRFKLFRDPKTGEERVYSLAKEEATLVRNPRLLETDLYKSIRQLFTAPPPLDVITKTVMLWRFNAETIAEDPQPFTFAGDDRLSFKRFDWKPQQGPFGEGPLELGRNFWRDSATEMPSWPGSGRYSNRGTSAASTSGSTGKTAKTESRSWGDFSWRPSAMRERESPGETSKSCGSSIRQFGGNGSCFTLTARTRSWG